MRAWCHRFRTRHGSFADAFVRVGPLHFHVSLMPSEGWRYRVSVRGLQWEVRW